MFSLFNVLNTIFMIEVIFSSDKTVIEFSKILSIILCFYLPTVPGILNDTSELTML